MASFAFAGFPAPFIRSAPAPNAAPVQQLIWGDFVELRGEATGEWVTVRGRRENGWMRKRELQAERLLEVNFVDIGQGDGAFIVTPKDRFILIDAGQGANMHRFLKWRFNLPLEADNSAIRFESAVITHSDQDHYLGFSSIFASPDFRFGTVYHNGIVERDASGSDILGPRSPRVNGKQYLTDIILDDQALRQRLADPIFTGTGNSASQYATMLKRAAESGRVAKFRALGADDQFVPGYEAGQDLSIEICGPVRETLDGQPVMRWLTNPAKTKNGHSVILRLVYRNVRILMGGDLNAAAENYLLAHYSGRDPESNDAAEREAIIAAARPIFEADIAKACHHGSADFTELFMRCTNALATVISSGDDESHAHPRPDTLGATGKHGRGPRPLIFSTELSRSTREYVARMQGWAARIAQKEAAVRDAATPAARERAQDALNRELRNVAVYGMINLRTDGERVLLAYKLERPAPGGREWDVHTLEPNAAGELAYVQD